MDLKELETKHPAASTEAKSLGKRSTFKEMKPAALHYDSLKDPSLSYFFSKPQIQKHLMGNGWVIFCFDNNDSLLKMRNAPCVRPKIEEK